MLSSGDVSQMFAAQNSAFSQQNAYAQQIGVPAPPNTLAAWGTPNAWGPRAPGFPGMAPPPSPVSFAPSGMLSSGYGTGTSLAGSMMSGIGGAASLAGAGLGIASMFGRMGAISPLLDPISGGMAGYARMGMMGAGLGIAAPLAIGALGAHAVGSFVHGGQQQQMINTQLGQFGFQNLNSRSGFGFTRDDAQAIGNQVRQLSHIPELMTSVQELTALIPRLKSMGVMQGVRDATEFSQRFKEAIHTIRDVSKMLGTTMGEAAEFFSHSRSVGFLGRQAQLQNVMNAQFTTAVTGMSNQQFMGMQRAGADMATGMGISRGRGSRAMTRMAQTLGMGLQSGQVSQEMLSDLTGLEGPEAVAAAAEQLVGVTANLAKGSAPGRLSMFGLAKFDGDGKYVGIDKDLADKYRRGLISRQELQQRVQGFTKEQKMAVSWRGDSLAMDFAGMAGPGGMARFFGDVLADRGYTSENAQGLYMKNHLGMSENQIEAFQQMKGIGSGDQDQDAMAMRSAREAEIRQRTDPKMIWERVKTKMHAKTFGRLEQAGSEVFTSIGKAWDSWVDDLVGRHVVSMSQEGMKTLSRAFSSQDGQRNLREMFNAATGLSARSGGDGLMTRTARGAMQWLGEVGSTDRSTGRNSRQQYEHIMSTFGIKDAYGAGAEAQLAGKYEGLLKYGQQQGFARIDDARATVARVISQLDKEGTFSQADDSKKLDLLSGRLDELLGNVRTPEGAQLRAALMHMEEKGLTKGMRSKGHALAVAFGSGGGRADRVNMQWASGSRKDAQDFIDIAAMQQNIAAARSGLSDRIGSDAVQTLSDRGGMSQAMLDILNQGENGELANALMGGKDATILKAFGKYGIAGKDIDTLKTLYHKVTGAGGNRETLKAQLANLSKAEQAKDFTLFQRGMADAAASISGDSPLKKALSEFADLKGGTQADFDSKYSAVQSALQDIRGRASRATSSDARNRILAEAGDLGSRLGQGLGKLSPRESRLIGHSMSAEKLASEMGVSVEDVKGSYSGGSITETVIRKIRDSAAISGANAAIVEKNKSAIAGDKDAELVNTLKGIQKSLDLNTTVVEMTTANLDDKKRAALQKLRQTGEVPKHDEKGNLVLQ